MDSTFIGVEATDGATLAAAQAYPPWLAASFNATRLAGVAHCASSVEDLVTSRQLTFLLLDDQDDNDGAAAAELTRAAVLGPTEASSSSVPPPTVAQLGRCAASLNSCAASALGHPLWLDETVDERPTNITTPKSSTRGIDTSGSTTKKALQPPLESVGQYQYFPWASEAARRDPRRTFVREQASLMVSTAELQTLTLFTPRDETRRGRLRVAAPARRQVVDCSADFHVRRECYALVRSNSIPKEGAVQDGDDGARRSRFGASSITDPHVYEHMLRQKVLRASSETNNPEAAVLFLSCTISRKCRYLHSLFLNKGDRDELLRREQKEQQSDAWRRRLDALRTHENGGTRIPSITAWFAFTDFDVCSSYGFICDVRPQTRAKHAHSMEQKKVGNSSSSSKSGSIVELSGIHLLLGADGTLAGNGYQHDVQSIIAPFNVHSGIILKQHRQQHLVERELAAFYCGRSRAGATVREALAFQHPLNHGCDGRTYPDNMMSHVFCWVPRGDNPTGRRLFDALAAGCIPVVLSDFVSSELPFKWKIDWRSCIIQVPESLFLQDPVAVVEALVTLHPSHIAELQRHGLQARAEVLYAEGPLHLTSQAADGTFHIDPGVRYLGATRNILTEVLLRQHRFLASHGRRGRAANTPLCNQRANDPEWDWVPMQASWEGAFRILH